MTNQGSFYYVRTGDSEGQMRYISTAYVCVIIRERITTNRRRAGRGKTPRPAAQIFCVKFCARESAIVVRFARFELIALLFYSYIGYVITCLNRISL